MSHPEYDSWDKFANQCYAHMDQLDDKIKYLNKNSTELRSLWRQAECRKEQLKEVVQDILNDPQHVARYYTQKQEDELRRLLE